MRLTTATFAAVCALLANGATAQDTRPLAFTNARLLTIEGEAIPRGTLVVRDGKIQALGATVPVPAGARVVDCAGGTLMPGLVSAFSRAGLELREEPRQEAPRGRGRGRRGGPDPSPGPRDRAQNQPATKVADRLYGKQSVFGDLLRAGVTSLALTPAAGGFPGLGAVLRPDGKTAEELIVDDDAFVFVGMARDAQVKKTLKEGFEKAKKALEERKKPKEPAGPAEPPKSDAKPAGETKPADGKTEGKTDTPPGPNPPPAPGPQPKPEEKKEGQGQQGQGQPAPQGQPAARPQPKDPHVEVLADLLEGKRRAIVEIDSAADLLHWYHAVGESLEFPRTLAVPRHDPLGGTFDVVLDRCKAMKCAVLLPPELSTKPRSRHLVHPARTLHEAGIEIGFLVGENGGAVRTLFFKLMELVRTGLPADTALRAVTLVPAKALGVEAQVGSLAAGKRADLLLWSGDPLDPASELKSVWLAGVEVERERKRPE